MLRICIFGQRVAASVKSKVRVLHLLGLVRAFFIGVKWANALSLAVVPIIIGGATNSFDIPCLHHLTAATPPTTHFIEDVAGGGVAVVALFFLGGEGNRVLGAIARRLFPQKFRVCGRWFFLAIRSRCASLFRLQCPP